MFRDASWFELQRPIFIDNSSRIEIDMRHPLVTMASAAPSPVPSKPVVPTSQQSSNLYREAISQGVRSNLHQLTRAGVLRPARPAKQCSGNWKPRMDLVDDPSSPNIFAIFELPGVKNENITLRMKDRRLVIVGNRADPYTEALAAVRCPLVQTSAKTNHVERTTTVTPKISADAVKIVEDGPNTPNIAILMNNSTRELRYGSFFRSIPLPEGIKQSEISTGIRDGMLTVTWPRVPTAVHSSTSKVALASDGTYNVMDTTDITPGARPFVPTEPGPVPQ